MSATADYMDKLRAARREGKRVEIEQHMGFPSASLVVAGDNARDADESNTRGERIARIIDKDGEREFECGVNAEQVRELLELDAVEV